MRIEPMTGSSGLSAGAPKVGAVSSLEKVAGQGTGVAQEGGAPAEPVPGAGPGQQPEVEAAIRSIQDVVSEENISLTFTRDEESGTMVIKMIDQQSGKPVLQIPSEAQLRLAEVLGKLQGNLVNQKA